MKRTRLGKTITSALLVGLAQSTALLAQNYNFTASGGGFEEISYTDINNPVLFNFPGYATDLSFGNMTGSLLYNAANGTVQVNATMPASQTSFNTTFSESPLINGVSTPVTVAINSQVTGLNNGIFSLSTGLLTHSPNSSKTWNVPVDIPVSGNYTVTTGGQTYTGNFNYDLNFEATMNLTTPGAANSSIFWFASPGAYQNRPQLNQITASNGVVVQLATTDPSPAGGPQYAYLKDSGSAQVQVPENLGATTSSCAIAGLLLTHQVFRNRKKAKA